jgi:hypothetical protein
LPLNRPKLEANQKLVHYFYLKLLILVIEGLAMAWGESKDEVLSWFLLFRVRKRATTMVTTPIPFHIKIPSQASSQDH